MVTLLLLLVGIDIFINWTTALDLKRLENEIRILRGCIYDSLMMGEDEEEYED